MDENIQDYRDNILTDIMLQISKTNTSTECAEECFEILNDEISSQLLLGVCMTNSAESQGLKPNEVSFFESQILSALSSVYFNCEESLIPFQLKDFFIGDFKEVSDKVNDSKKFQFAISQFVSAFLAYDNFEQKYPEISKVI